MKPGNVQPFLTAALVVLLGGATLVGERSARAEPGAPTVVDRTVECRTLQNGGIYEIEARAHSGVRASGSVWKTLPFAVITTGSTGSAATQLDNAFLWISAGRPSATTWLEESFFPTLAHQNGTLAIKLGRCRSTRTRVPLVTTGLGGGQAGQLGEIFDCASPRNVLVRVRARLESSGGLRSGHGFLRTTTPLTQAALAVRTRSGKMLAYASVAASGKTRLFTAPSCTRD
jgi:hypothetical protein